MDVLFVAYLVLLTVRVEIRMPREIVTVQLGQCGNQSKRHSFRVKLRTDSETAS